MSNTSEASRGSSILSVSLHEASSTSAATTSEDSDDSDEEVLTPTGDIPSFLGDTTRSEGFTQSKGKGKQVVYEDGVLSEVV